MACTSRTARTRSAQTPIDNTATGPVVAAVNFERYRYRIFLSAQVAAARNWKIYSQNNGGGSFSIERLDYRLAMPSEVAAQRADGNASLALAQITSEAATRTSVDAALASTQNTLVAQLAGSQGSGLSSRISDNATAAANATGAVALRTSTLEATAGSLSASLSQQSGAIASLQGRTGVFWQVTGIAGNGRAQITLFADANGGGGVDIVGNLAVSGNLLVAGSVQTSAHADNSITDGDGFANNNVLYGQGGVSASGGSYSPGSGGYYDPDSGQYISTGGWQDLVNSTVHVTAKGRFTVTCTFKQDFQNSNQPWCCELLINGQVMDAAWGGFYQDKMFLQGTADIAGSSDVNYQVRWAGNTGGTTARNPRGSWQVRYK